MKIKRIALWISALLLLLCLCFTVSCQFSGSESDHIHHYEETVIRPSCTEDGYTLHKCACGDSYVDGYVKATGHKMKDGVCKVCGAKESTAAVFEFSYQEDGYVLTGVKNAVGEVIIPGSYEGKPVIGIAEDVFLDIESVESVEEVEKVIAALGVTSISIPASVTSIDESAFIGCIGLSSITVAKGNSRYHTKNNCLIETEAKKLIAGCKNSIIPDDGSVTFIGGRAFDSCVGLTSVTIPNSITSIEDGAFSGCYRLVEVRNNSSLSIVKGSSDNGGVGEYALDVFTSADDVSGIVKKDDYLFYTKGDALYLLGYVGAETDIVLPADYEGQKYEIYSFAFAVCINLTGITIPDSVTSIGYGAFYFCFGLKSITIPDSVTSIGDAAFDYCTGLTSITIPDSVTGIGGCVFVGCTGLTNITIPDSVTSIGYFAFERCTGLTSVTIPDSVTDISRYAFYGCTGLTSIMVAVGNPAYHSDGNCLIETASKTLIFGCQNSVIPTDGSVTSIGWRAFDGCTGLTSVTIPDSVTSIGWYAFFDCTGLTSITIPDSVTSIDMHAFSGCVNLTSITYKGTMAEWENIVKEYDWNRDARFYFVHCTDGDFPTIW